MDVPFAHRASPSPPPTLPSRAGAFCNSQKDSVQTGGGDLSRTHVIGGCGREMVMRSKCKGWCQERVLGCQQDCVCVCGVAPGCRRLCKMTSAPTEGTNPLSCGGGIRNFYLRVLEAELGLRWKVKTQHQPHSVRVRGAPRTRVTGEGAHRCRGAAWRSSHTAKVDASRSGSPPAVTGGDQWDHSALTRSLFGTFWCGRNESWCLATVTCLE